MDSVLTRSHSMFQNADVREVFKNRNVVWGSSVTSKASQQRKRDTVFSPLQSIDRKQQTKLRGLLEMEVIDPLSDIGYLFMG